MSGPATPQSPSRPTGQPEEVPEHTAVYDLRPPDGFEGVAISVKTPDYYDPNPVTRADAKAAAEWHGMAEGHGKDTWMYGFIVGLLVFGGIWFLMTVVPWLLGQIGGAGGGGPGETITGMLFLFGGPVSVRGLWQRVCSAFRGA